MVHCSSCRAHAFFNILKSKLSKLNPPLYVAYSQIIKLFKQIDDINLLTKENFINIIKDVIQRDLNDDKKKKWKVLMPINISLPKRKIKINGQLYQIKTYNILGTFKNMNSRERFPR